MENIQQEIIVKKYQETQNEILFETILKYYRSRIQGRAYNASARFRIDDVEAESALVEALWEAARTWKEEKGVPFTKYVSVKFNQTMNHLFTQIQIKKCPFEIEYFMDSEGNYELEDPKQDIENLVAEDDSVKCLYQYIKSKKSTAAEVAMLRASGYEHVEIAEMFDYKPDSVKSIKDAKRMWVKRRLEDAQKPAMDYYFKVLGEDSLPIRLRA